MHDWRKKSGRPPITELTSMYEERFALHDRVPTRRRFPTEKKHAILDEIEAVVADGGNQVKVLRKYGLYAKNVRIWRKALDRTPLPDLKKRQHKGAELYVKHLEAGLDAYIARARKKAVKLHKAFVNADSSTLKGAMTKVNSAEDISKILAGLNEYKTEELGEIQFEAVGIVFEQVAAIREKMLGLVEVPDER
jgi:transposase-like protein